MISKEETTVENIKHKKLNNEKNNLIEILENKLQENKNKILEKKLLAKQEVEMVLNRSNKEINISKKFSLEKLIINFLPIFDNIERTLNSIENNQLNKILLEIKNKIEFISELLNKSFKLFNIKKIQEKNVSFDPSIHEAMSIHYTNEVESNKIVTVMQPGYILHESRLLRPAMVVVSKKKI
ncbi:nucleotide exchange factor GrpE [Buchnera aphidicola]|uniref:Protein GrpE n=1 Tax=Buchnera aphidicola (Lipaphis pseudobrassicae) TaxID=1258543 RepID=A0A4D6Y075_9GAMM|nr:nucleotide exchange factor GrpE [Buchnera aphidicola]QCI22117.1 nucleotide exchange factor GrpE [Buchnera aphidicola (Lipaphis pseudobrassicae)]